MECGSGEWACQLIALLAKHGIELAPLADWLPWLEQRTRENIQAIIGLLGFAYGVWRNWYYREAVLHKRLDEYISDQEVRLHGARANALELLERPAPGKKYGAPLFTMAPLNRVLNRRRLVSAFPSIPFSSNSQGILADLGAQIVDKVKIAERALSYRREELATSYILNGAVASANAAIRDKKTRSAQLDRDALAAFRNALKLRGASHRIEAKEYEAHQLRRLERWEDALAAYRHLERMANSIPDRRNRAIATGRAKRYQAEIEQMQAAAGSAIARDLIAAAIGLRDQHAAPFSEWSAIEQGEMHYIYAYICSKLYNHHNKERENLQSSLSEYERVLKEATLIASLTSARVKRLRAAAKEGKKRCKAALDDECFDSDWLNPSTK